MASPWIFLFMFLSIWKSHVLGQINNFIVTKFGAVADGKTDNRQAFENAWAFACETAGGTVTVPVGSFYLSGGDFNGPCAGQTRFNLDGTMIANSGPLDRDYWLTFNKVDSFTLSGNGLLDGNGAATWSRCHYSDCGSRPDTLKIASVTNALIEGIKLSNSKMFHVHVHQSQNLTINSVHITAPADSPNTDGIHVSRSDTVRVLGSTISTGDDCVSIGDGARNVNVSGVFCGPGHGISIGSLGKYAGEQDVSGITVRNCTLSRTDNGARIKTWARSLSSSVVSDVTFSDIILDHAANPIVIDQFYCPHGRGQCGGGGDSSVAIRGVKYVRVRGTAATERGISIECSRSHGCQDVEFVGLDITYNGGPTTSVCSGVSDRFLGDDIQVPPRC